MSQKIEQDHLALIVLGATGFTGRIAAKYVATHLPCHLRWGIAGRNASKLKQIRTTLESDPNPPSNENVVDLTDAAQVLRVVSQARLVINFAGPFNRTGENVISACVQTGTHYLDITGETLWVRKMIDRYQAAALKTGTWLIPFSGFDSVPSDLGAWHVVNLAKKKAPAATVSQVVSLYSIRGGLNGGTYASALDFFDLGTAAEREDPFLLVPERMKSQFGFSELKWPVRHAEKKMMAPPFLMASVNSRIVYQSQAILADGKKDWTPYEYLELQNVPRNYAVVAAWSMVIVSRIFMKLGEYSALRYWMRKWGPQSGDGPSEKVRKKAFFRAEFAAYEKNQLLAEFKMEYPGDPSNEATVMLICESAFCLLLDQKEIAQNPKNIRGGFLTPSTAFGDALLVRLVQAGVKITITE